MAATFLQRAIFVVQQLGNGQTGWSCRKFVLTQVTRHHRVIESTAKNLLSVEELIDDVVAAKILIPELLPLLLLRIKSYHYSALIHSGRFAQLPGCVRELAASVEALESGIPDLLTRRDPSNNHVVAGGGAVEP